MTTYKHYFLILLTVFFTLISCDSEANEIEKDPPVTGDNGEDNEEEEEENNDTFNYIWEEETDGYQVYRIPAIVEAKSGKLLAFAEARKRKSDGDSGDIDLVLKTSKDKGKTWSSMKTVWDEGVNTSGNPVPIVDMETGRIHLLMTWNDGDDRWGDINSGTGEDTRRVYYTWSDDEGETWQEPEEITSSVKDPSWNWYGTGPVHGIQIKEGTYAGRLVSPNYYTVRENGQSKSYSHVIYSDDNGKTWKAGEAAPSSGIGECTVAELSDGSLMLNMRPDQGTGRKFAVSEDGGATWGAVQTDYTLTDPRCQGSIISTIIGGEHILFHANPASTERVNMTIKKSTDDGASWERFQLVHPGASAYSDLVILSTGEVGVLYEGGIGRPYEGIAFELFEIE